MIVVESYTKIVSDTINTHLPNSSGYNKYNHVIADNNPSVVVDVIDSVTSSPTEDCIDYLSLPFSSLSSSQGNDTNKSLTLKILRWMVHHFKIVYHACLKRYLSHPIVLMILPLCIGLSVGFLVGWYYHHYLHSGAADNASDSADDSTKRDGRRGKTSSKNKSNLNDVDLHKMDLNDNDDDDQEKRDTQARTYLKSNLHTQKESTIPTQHLPKHIAIIMDGNRRYGKTKYNSITRGHWDGSKTLIDMAKWCIAEQIPILTVYAFSTENWNRSQGEVTSLMKIFRRYCDELRVEAKKRGICVRVLSTETDQVSF